MTARRFRFTVAATLIVGMLAGIYVQHRWPLGRVFQDNGPAPVSASRSLTEVAGLPRSQRLVIVAAGQSNAGNHGSTRASAGAGVYAFAEGRLFNATDPLPGASGTGGSVWTRLGARYIVEGHYQAVVIAPIAQGSTRVDDWAAGGRCHPRLMDTLQQLTAAGAPADFILWQQGETEAWEEGSGAQYSQTLQSIVKACHRVSPETRFVIARSTYATGETLNEQIRLTHAEPQRVGALPGPNLDQLSHDYRSDGVHFNDRGLSAAAALWFEALSPYLKGADVPKTSR